MAGLIDGLFNTLSLDHLKQKTDKFNFKGFIFISAHAVYCVYSSILKSFNFVEVMFFEKFKNKSPLK